MASGTIDHSLLLKKLEHYGLIGIANHWISNYLAEGKQYVEIKKLNLNLWKLCVECHRDQS